MVPRLGRMGPRKRGVLIVTDIELTVTRPTARRDRWRVSCVMALKVAALISLPAQAARKALVIGIDK